MTGNLIVVPYDSEWPARFECIRTVLAAALKHVEVLAIEHVGSTSVPGLAAKPVIDIDIVVDASSVGAASTALEALGYEPLGELGVADRWAFRQPQQPASADLTVRHNLYVTVEGSLSVRNHRALRDTLRNDHDLRDRYGAVKLALADRTDDIDVYIDGKTDIVLEILRRGGITPLELEELERINRR
jgi:GrpB-like predicted nucleotidyltransferase (UPF0157 family)